VVREVIEDAACAGGSVAAGHALAIKEDVFALVVPARSVSSTTPDVMYQ
jgi:hypothetical protein